jgi:Na+-driven multidrug efflux pump
MFAYMAVIYWAIRGFGPEAQAGFGVGSRVMQAIFLPAMAIAFATAPVAGRNMGAGDGPRVRRTLAAALWMGTAVMALLVVPCQLAPEPMIRVFSTDPAVVAVGAEFLRIISWNFVATGVIFTAGGLFQALGNTVPSLAASAIRLATFAVPAVWMSTAMAGFELRHLWYLSVATVLVQMCLSLVLLRHEMGRKLTPSTT